MVGFSFFRWFWLARTISGSSHVDKIINGVEIISEKNIGEKIVLVILFCHRRVRLVRLIRKLYDEMLVHTSLLLDNQVSGISMMDGKIIFNIVED